MQKISSALSHVLSRLMDFFEKILEECDVSKEFSVLSVRVARSSLGIELRQKMRETSISYSVFFDKSNGNWELRCISSEGRGIIPATAVKVIGSFVNKVEQVLRQ